MDFISSEPSASKSPTPKKRRRKDPTITTRVYNEQEWKQLQLMNTAAVPGEYRPKPVNNKSSLSSGTQKRSIDKSSKETVLALESRKLVGNSKGLVIESNNSTSSSTREKDISGYIEMNPRKVLNGENEGKIKKENKSEFVEPSTSGSVYPVQAMVSSLFLSQYMYLFCSCSYIVRFRRINLGIHLYLVFHNVFFVQFLQQLDNMDLMC